MARTKNFTREEVLNKSVPLFWKKGFAETSVHDLEVATGVNKSGLYSEFANKEDLYLASLSHYLAERGRKDWLLEEPLGWANIEKFLKQAEYYTRDLRGCLLVYSIREIPGLSKEAQGILAKYHSEMRKNVLVNIQAVEPKGDPERITDMVMLLYSGVSLAQNLRKKNEQSKVTTSDLISLLKRL